MEEDGMSRHLEKKVLQDDWWKSRHLKCSHTQDKTHFENSQVSQKHSCRVFLLYSNSMWKYMEGCTFYIGRSDLESKMREW